MYVQLTSPHHRQTAYLNLAKHFEIVNTISMAVPWNVQANESNLEKIVLCWLSQVSCSSKSFFEETSIAKNLVLSILRINPKIQASKVSEFVPLCANKDVKEKEEKRNMTLFTNYHKQLLLTVSDYLIHNVSV